MKLSTKISLADYLAVKNSSAVYFMLIFAIHIQENPTERDWWLGYDDFTGAGGRLPQNQGFDKQVAAVAAFLRQDMALPITADSIMDFSQNHWKCGNGPTQNDYVAQRTAWANGVWSIYSSLVDDLASQANDWITQAPIDAVTAGLWTNVPSLANMANPAFVMALIAQTGLNARGAVKGTTPLFMPKFGRKHHTVDERDLRCTAYRKAALPSHPAQFGHESLIGVDAWGMLGNNTVGDCVQAAADHEEELWSAEGSTEAVFTDANALADYSAETGYNPNNPDSDQGTEIRVSLKYRQKTGMIDAGGKRHKIDAYLALNLDVDEALEAAYIFSAVEIGLDFPQSAMDQLNAGQPWDLTNPDRKKNPIIGGHDVTIVGFDGTYILIVTWGILWKMTLAFFKAYCEEAWALLSEGFLKSGKSPEGFDLTTLDADLAAITTDPIPTPAPAPTPTPTPTPTGLTIVLNVGTGALSVTGGSNQATINGVEVPIDSNPGVLPFLDPKTGRAYIPDRFIADALGCVVDWDEAKMQVTIFQPAADSAPAVSEYVEEFPPIGSSGKRRAR
jgi:hypothetical protein